MRYYKSLLLFVFFTSCITVRNNTSNYQFCGNKTISRLGKATNICKELKENVLVYCVFIDEKNSSFWNGFDVEESKTSINTSIKWIEEQSKKNNINLTISPIFHSLKDSIRTIEKNFSYKSLTNHLLYPDGLEKLEKWSKNIALQVNSDLLKNHKNINKDIKGRDGLIANLQTIYDTHNIALCYILNNRVKKETSVTLFSSDCSSNKNTSEYTIIAESRNSAVIAHEILHLFGADDFYTFQYQTYKIPKEIRKKYKIKQKYGQQFTGVNNKTNILREYPNAIMRNVNLDNLDSLNISPITQYLIGWRTKHDLKTRDKELMLYGDFVEID